MNRKPSEHGATSRRAFLEGAAPAALLIGCRRQQAPREGDVTATEDLMREHGVIRRLLVAYRESAARLRTDPRAVPADALRRAATLMRRFGEDYHERQLEEAYIFPPLRSDPSLAPVVAALLQQHERGRQITDYVLAASRGPIVAQAAGNLAGTLDAFARMYEEHTAFEDTLVFPAWKKTLSPAELDAMGDRFEDIEHKTFGKDGFDDAVDQIAGIEKSLGIELAALTASAPPPV